MREAVLRVRAYLKQKRWHEYLVILPTEELRAYFIDQVLGEDVKGMFYPRIYTLDSFIDEFLRQEDIFVPVASRVMRHELMKKAEPGRSSGFITALLKAVAELKKAGISPAFLEQTSREEELSHLPYLAEKYQAYEKLLKDSGWHDPEDRYLLARNLLKEGRVRMLQNVEYFYADWFFDLTPVEEDILKAVAQKARTSELYFLPAGKADFEKFREVKPWLPEKDGHVAYYVFTGEKAGEIFPEVQVLTASGREEEVRGAVKIIKEYLDKGGRMEDIALVCRNPDKYAPILRKVCDRAGLPLALDVKRPLATSILINNIISLLKLRLELQGGIAFSKLAGLNYIFPNLSLCPFQKDRLLKIDEMQEADGENGEPFSSVLLPVLEKLSLLPDEGTYREMGEAVSDFLKTLPLTENILSLTEKISLKERFALAGRDLRAWEKFGELLQEMKNEEWAGDKKCSLDEFIRQLEFYLNTSFYIYSPGQPAGIKVLTPGSLRGLSFPLVVVLGMDEDTFPLKPESSWLMRDREIESLRKKGVFILTSRDIYRREKILFYLILRSAGEKLYFMHPLSDEEGEEILPSPFLEAVAEAAEEPLLPHKVEPWLSYEEQLALFAPHYPGETASYLKAKGMADEFVAFVRQGKPFDPQDSFVSEGALSRLAEEYKDAVWTVSQLDSYIRCPLQYFFRYELKLKTAEEEVDEISPLTLGTWQHEALCSFFRTWKEEGYPSLTEEEVKRRLDILLAEKKPLENVHPLVWEIEREKIAGQLAVLVQETIKREDLVPDFMEWGFEMELEKEGACPMKIAGIIDRIDREKTGSKESWYAVYDYKNSKSSIPSQKAVLALASLQLPLYVMAAEEKLEGEVTEAGYINLKEAGLGTVLLRESGDDKKGKGGRRNLISDDDWREWLEKAREKALEIRDNIAGRGNFPPLPHPALNNVCEYCAFASICFYR